MLNTPTKTPDAQRVFADIANHLAIAASFDGYWKPNLLVDDARQPRTVCLMIPPRAYLAGIPTNPAFNRELAQHIQRVYPPTADALFYFDSPLWGALLEEMLSGREVIHAIREHYALTTAPTDWQFHLPQGIQIYEVTDEILDQGHWKNHSKLIVEIGRSNPSVTSFQERCFGVCAMEGDTIAGWCLSENNVGARCEIGSETVEAYRQLGIATSMARALIDLAHERGIKQIGWDCWKTNTGSGATARRAGFRRVSEYPVVFAGAR
jgi:RimJ/RimL family protein N-acetyltransferase